MERQKTIIKTSIAGIIVNLILVGFKAAVGFISGSIAIVLDALNNFTDALSSIVTIIGTKLANKAPDKKHPYGYGRIEYFSSIAVAAIILYAGITAVIESIQKIQNPGSTDYSIPMLIIIAVAVLTKFFFGRYVKRVGQKVDSGALTASGQDALMDAILSLSTLIAAILHLVWSISIEGFLGVIIAAFIIKAAIDMMAEPLSLLIGSRADKKTASKIRRTVASYPEVQGVYDLSLHNYGPSKTIATLHIQVPDNLTARDLHKLTRAIAYKIFDKFGIIATVGIYAANADDEYSAVKTDIKKLLKSYTGVRQMHGFYVDGDEIFFDIIIDFDVKEPEQIRQEIIQKLEQKHPDYRFNIILDADVTD